jgi:hypothetical protein
VFCLPLFLLCIQRVIKFWGSWGHSQAKGGEEEKMIHILKLRNEKEINEDLIEPVHLEQHSFLYLRNERHHGGITIFKLFL